MIAFIIIGTILCGLVIFKLMFELSVRNLHKSLPTIEMKIQRALIKLEEMQAEKIIKAYEKNEMNKKVPI